MPINHLSDHLARLNLQAVALKIALLVYIIDETTLYYDKLSMRYTQGMNPSDFTQNCWDNSTGCTIYYNFRTTVECSDLHHDANGAQIWPAVEPM